MKELPTDIELPVITSPISEFSSLYESLFHALTSEKFAQLEVQETFPADLFGVIKSTTKLRNTLEALGACLTLEPTKGQAHYLLPTSIRSLARIKIFSDIKPTLNKLAQIMQDILENTKMVTRFAEPIFLSLRAHVIDQLTSMKEASYISFQVVLITKLIDALKGNKSQGLTFSELMYLEDAVLGQELREFMEKNHVSELLEFTASVSEIPYDQSFSARTLCQKAADKLKGINSKIEQPAPAAELNSSSFWSPSKKHHNPIGQLKKQLIQLASELANPKTNGTMTKTDFANCLQKKGVAEILEYLDKKRALPTHLKDLYDSLLSAPLLQYK